MSMEHVFYIPVSIILGLVLGFVWGRSAALKEFVAKEKLKSVREAERAERKKVREAA